MTHSKLLRGTAIAAVLMPVSAHADDITIWDLFSVDRIGTAMVHSALGFARSYVELRYEDIDIRPLDGRLALTGLSIIPYEREDYPGCEVTLDRLVITTSPILETEYSGLNIDISGANVPLECLDPWDRDDAEMLGFDTFAIDRALIQAEYHNAPGSAWVSFDVHSSGNGSLTGTLDFDYAAFNADDQEPILHLDAAYAEFTDDGLWERFAGEFPGFIFDATMLNAMLAEELLPAQSSATDIAPPATPVPEAPAAEGGKPGDVAPDQAPAPAPEPAPAPAPVVEDPDVAEARDILAAASQAVSEFANNPTRITIEMDPPGAVWLEEDLFDEFYTVAAALDPVLTAGIPEPTILDSELADLVLARLNGEDPDMTEAQRITVATALLDGDGVPRSPGLALDMLWPLLEDGNTEAIGLLSGHLDLLPAEDAYLILHGASANGDRAAFAALDRAEQMLGIEDVFALQGFDLPDLTGAETASELAAMARAAQSGFGAPRSYAVAYYLALTAEAAGDRSAGAVIADLEAMGRMVDDEAAWFDMLDDVAFNALSDWVEANATSEADEQAEPEAEEAETDQ